MRPKLSYANNVSTPCLFLLLTGGAAYAASHLAKNSVGSKQLKKNAVTTAKIKKEAVSAAKVKKGTLTGTQINASTLGTVPTAQTANSIVPPGPPFDFEGAGFYKDREGVVHLKGLVQGGRWEQHLPSSGGIPAGERKGPPQACRLWWLRGTDWSDVDSRPRRRTKRGWCCPGARWSGKHKPRRDQLPRRILASTAGASDGSKKPAPFPFSGTTT